MRTNLHDLIGKPPLSDYAIFGIMWLTDRFSQARVDSNGYWAEKIIYDPREPKMLSIKWSDYSHVSEPTTFSDWVKEAKSAGFLIENFVFDPKIIEIVGYNG